MIPKVHLNVKCDTFSSFLCWNETSYRVKVRNMGIGNSVQVVSNTCLGSKKYKTTNSESVAY